MSDVYAKAGVDYSQIRPFKRRMVEVVKATRDFPSRRNVLVDHTGCYEYVGPHIPKWKQVTEGLGNKNVLAEIFYRLTGQLRFADIALDNMRMALNDVAAQGAMPVTYTDEVAAGNSEWFNDRIRGHDMAQGFLQGCQHDSVALVGGESPSLRFLVKDFPVMSGCTVGVIVPGTGGGLAKLMEAIPGEMTFLIKSWPEIPEVLAFMQDKFQMGLKSCLETFNMGVGYYLIVPRLSVERTCHIGRLAGYSMTYLGDTVRGPWCVRYRPADICLDPTR